MTTDPGVVFVDSSLFILGVDMESKEKPFLQPDLLTSPHLTTSVSP